MHANAAGLGIPAQNVPSLLNYMNTHFSKESFDNCYLVDYVLNAKEDISNLLYIFASHPEYFGNGIDEPRFIIKNIPLSNVTFMGVNKDSTKIIYNQIEYVRFKDVHFVDTINVNRKRVVDIYCKAGLNTWGGRTSIQCIIDDYEFKFDESRYAF